jgi:hypothetical protein
MAWSEINILNKNGMLSNEDRKEPLEHGCQWVTFKSCVDLSEGVRVIPYGRGKISVDHYSQDLSSFMCWWEHFVKCDLNGFSGFSHVKFILEGIELVDTNKEKEL